jgi:TRAP-type C4-dicarboxylate transport system permease large subunit
MLLLTAPTVIPLIKEAGFDLVWFGIIYVVLSEIGMITPPMGLNLFVIQGISKEKLSDVIKGSIPFFNAMILLILLLCVFPDLVVWLPNLLFG